MLAQIKRKVMLDFFLHSCILYSFGFKKLQFKVDLFLFRVGSSSILVSLLFIELWPLTSEWPLTAMLSYVQHIDVTSFTILETNRWDKIQESNCCPGSLLILRFFILRHLGRKMHHLGKQLCSDVICSSIVPHMARRRLFNAVIKKSRASTLNNVKNERKRQVAKSNEISFANCADRTLCRHCAENNLCSGEEKVGLLICIWPLTSSYTIIRVWMWCTNYAALIVTHFIAYFPQKPTIFMNFLKCLIVPALCRPFWGDFDIVRKYHVTSWPGTLRGHLKGNIQEYWDCSL